MPERRWSSRLSGAVGVLLIAALGARVAWWLLEPLVPVLVISAVLLGLLRLAAGRQRW